MGAMLLISAVSAGLDIYKQVRGCDDITPSLNSKIEQAKNLQQELLDLRDKVNLAWVPGKFLL